MLGRVIDGAGVDFVSSGGPQQTRKFLKKTGISDHLTCLLRSLYAGQEITEQNMEQWVQNWESSTTRLYIVTLLI